MHMYKTEPVILAF